MSVFQVAAGTFTFEW